MYVCFPASCIHVYIRLTSIPPRTEAYLAGCCIFTGKAWYLTHGLPASPLVLNFPRCCCIMCDAGNLNWWMLTSSGYRPAGAEHDQLNNTDMTYMLEPIYLQVAHS